MYCILIVILTQQVQVYFLNLQCLRQLSVKYINRNWGQNDLASVNHKSVSNTLHREKKHALHSQILSLCWCSLKLREGNSLPQDAQACQRTSLIASRVLLPHFCLVPNSCSYLFCWAHQVGSSESLAAPHSAWQHCWTKDHNLEFSANTDREPNKTQGKPETSRPLRLQHNLQRMCRVAVARQINTFSYTQSKMISTLKENIEYTRETTWETNHFS